MSDPRTRPLLAQFPLQSRREVLEWAAGATALALLPSGCKTTIPPSPTSFFTVEERVALGALADAVLPPDQGPGASQLGAVNYIERLLTALDGPAPAVFANGPYSGRQPFAGENGLPDPHNVPPNSFAERVPLDRISELSWEIYLYGSSSVPGGVPNEALLGPVVGLRDQVKNALATAMAEAPASFAQLNTSEVVARFDALSDEFRDLLIDLVSQAAFCAPEYGGNKNQAGWKMVHFEGDSQPLGYSQFDAVTNRYRERPDAPMSGPNPGVDPEPMDAQVHSFVFDVVSILGGRAR